MLCTTNSGLRGSMINFANFWTIPRRRSTGASSMTPPSDHRRGAVRHRVIEGSDDFLKADGWKAQRSIVSSDMAVWLGMIAGVDNGPSVVKLRVHPIAGLVASVRGRLGAAAYRV